MNYQTKSKWFPMVKMNLQRYWQRLLNSPAKSNESVGLELSWAWEPTYKDQLAELVWAKNPSVVSLAKTWTDRDRLVQVQRQIDFKNMLEVTQRNKARGLVIFWKEDFDMSIEAFSPNHIDSMINKNKEDEWRFTAFYGKPDTRFSMNH